MHKTVRKLLDNIILFSYLYIAYLYRSILLVGESICASCRFRHLVILTVGTAIAFADPCAGTILKAT